MWVWAVQLKNDSHPIRAKIAAENPPKQNNAGALTQPADALPAEQYGRLCGSYFCNAFPRE